MNKAITGTPILMADRERTLVQTKRDLGLMLKELRKHKIVAADTETTGLVWQNKDIMVGASFAIPGKSWYVEFDWKDPCKKSGTFDFEAVTEASSEITAEDLNEFWATDRTWVFHNAKFDLHMIATAGGQVGGVVEDTMLLLTQLDPDRLEPKEHPQKKGLSLKDAAVEFLNVRASEDRALHGYMEKNGLKKGDHCYVPIPLLYPYACADVEYTLALYKRFMAAVGRRGTKNIQAIERNLTRVIYEMEEVGTPVDIEYLEKCRLQLEQEIDAMDDRIRAMAPDLDNPNSNPQILEWFAAQDIELPNAQEKTLLACGHKLGPLLVERRKRAKLLETYVTNLLAKAVAGRVSMDLRQYGARTGRMACAEPNLQNIPSRGDKIIQRAFINARPGYQILYLDYKQIEMVIFAAISGDENLKQAVRDNVDLHTMVASVMNDCPVESVTDEMRKPAKTMNFGILFGQGIEKTARQMGVSKIQGEMFRNEYFRRLPSVRTIQREMQRLTKRRKFAKTLLGRVRPITDPENAYIGLNSTIQGTAADIMKIAVLRVAAYLKKRGYESRMLMVIHDEIVIEHKIDEPIIPDVIKLMTHNFPIELPLRVDVEATVTNWAEKETLTDAVYLERLLADGKGWDGEVDWDSIGPDVQGIEVASKYFREPLWIVRKPYGDGRLEIAA